MKVPRFSLRTKLVLCFLLPLLPLLVLVLYTYRFESTTWTDSVYEDQRQTAQAIAALTDANFDQAFAFAWAVANDSLVHTLDPSVLDLHLQQLRALYAQYPGVAVYNARGDLVGISSPWPIDLPRVRDAQDVPYLDQVLYTGQPAVSPVVSSRRSLLQQASVAVAVPIRDGAGKTTGVVSVPIPLDALSSQLQSMTLSPEQNIILADPGGTAALITRLPNLSWEQRYLRDFEPVQAARQGKSSQLESLVLPFTDGNRIGAFIPSPKYHWIVGVTERQDVALVPCGGDCVTGCWVWALSRPSASA